MVAVCFVDEERKIYKVKEGGRKVNMNKICQIDNQNKCIAIQK